ncbi:MAG: hypothetical protein BWK76_01380 [Desulfobulbaceae bacterium A2]|nr:MAG: hypothetical protein BWK76_01380 [Desulfobulbaceae bacterium A2]
MRNKPPSTPDCQKHGPDAKDQLHERITRLERENDRLRRSERAAVAYIRDKVDQMLNVLGTVPLRPEELDDDTLLQLDPIGIISDSFTQILEHLRQTNHSLTAARDEIKAIFDSVGGGIMVLDQHMQIVAYNQKMKEIFFAGESQIIGCPCREVLCRCESSVDCFMRQALIQGETVRRSPWEFREASYEVVATPIPGTDGKGRLVVLYLDISERRRMELALRESEERYRDLFENATDLIQSVGPDGRLIFVNRAWCATLGYAADEISTLSMADIIHPDWREQYQHCLQELFRTGGQHELDMVLLARDGREIAVEGVAGCRWRDGKAVATRCILRDVTEQRRLQQELLQRQKLESVGVLAGGIAHDFNNLLTAVTGNLSLARSMEHPSDGFEPLLQEMEDAAQRAQALTRQLLTFARGGAPVKKIFSPMDLVRQVASFTVRGSRCRLDIQCREPVWPVEVDGGQISQVMQNLVLNASQAMPEGGVITLILANCLVTPQRGLALTPGKYVCIAVQDQGCGIAPEHLDRIFDPYFSTRAGGSGLGLAVSYTIVKKHKGCLTVSSAAGVGTTITVYLPAVPDQALTPLPVVQAPTHGRGKILLMDDEPSILKVARQMLQHLGYTVETASHGEEALHCFLAARQAGAPFDVSILDLTIPGGMGGVEVMERMRSLEPTVKTVVSSGYAEGKFMAEYKKYGFSAVLPKPYTLETLSVTLASLLGSDRTHAKKPRTTKG